MAFRAAKNFPLTLVELGSGRRAFTSPTTPKMKPVSRVMDADHHNSNSGRETVPEVSDPDRTMNSAAKFIDGSFLRKVSHIQENKTTLNDPIHPNPFTRPRTVETLKTVGVEPARR
ncbi:uncharacterized protein HKW66_Vig0163480 [Vigna angularis]|uniref:Uncharacterized protein n=1 Tax=Phaseolus angularis TaxID=3914 RepID=A0A8T0JHQ7_PHAAN|nr:uncharacterized protein HKW66_Vig0163480 [Vigna angularis]